MSLGGREMMLIIRASNQASSELRKIAGDVRGLSAIEGSRMKQNQLAGRQADLMARKEQNLQKIRQLGTNADKTAMSLAAQRAALMQKEQGIRNKIQETYKKQAIDRTGYEKKLADLEKNAGTLRAKKSAALKQITTATKAQTEAEKAMRMANTPAMLRTATSEYTKQGKAIEKLKGEIRGLGPQFTAHNAKVAEAASAYSNLEAKSQKSLRNMRRQIIQMPAAWQRHNTAVGEAAGRYNQLTGANQKLDRQLAQSVQQMSGLREEERQLKWQNFSKGAAVMRHVGRTMAFVGAGGVVAFGLMAKSAADYQTQVGLAATQTLNAGASFKQTEGASRFLQKAILKLAQDFPASTKDMADAAYEIYSSTNLGSKGVKGLRQGVDLLRVANQAAVAGGSSLIDSTDALVSVMNTYGKSTAASKGLLDLMFASVRFGRMTFTDLANSMKTIAPAGKVANQSLGTLLGSFSYLTTKLGPAFARVGIARLLETLGRKKMVSGLKDAGVAITDTTGRLLPLPDIIDKINAKFPKLAQGGVQLQQFFKKMSGTEGTIQARRAFVFLIQNADKYRKFLGQVTHDQGEFDKSRKVMEKTPGVQWAKFTNQLKAFAIMMGNTVLPVIARLAPYFKQFANWFNGLSAGTRKSIGEWAVFGSAAMLVVGILGMLSGSILGIVGMIGRFGGLKSIGVIFLGIYAAIKTLIGGFDELGGVAGTVGKMMFGSWQGILGTALLATTAFMKVGKSIKAAQLSAAASGGEAAAGGFIPMLVGMPKKLREVGSTFRTISGTVAKAGGSFAKTRGILRGFGAVAMMLPGPLKVFAAALGVTGVMAALWKYDADRMKKVNETLEASFESVANAARIAPQQAQIFGDLGTGIRNTEQAVDNVKRLRIQIRQIKKEISDMKPGDERKLRILDLHDLERQLFDARRVVGTAVQALKQQAGGFRGALGGMVLDKQTIDNQMKFIRQLKLIRLAPAAQTKGGLGSREFMSNLQDSTSATMKFLTHARQLGLIKGPINATNATKLFHQALDGATRAIEGRGLIDPWKNIDMYIDRANQRLAVLRGSLKQAGNTLRTGFTKYVRDAQRLEFPTLKIPKGAMRDAFNFSVKMKKLLTPSQLKAFFKLEINPGALAKAGGQMAQFIRKQQGKRILIQVIAQAKKGKGASPAQLRGLLGLGKGPIKVPVVVDPQKPKKKKLKGTDIFSAVSAMKAVDIPSKVKPPPNLKGIKTAVEAGIGHPNVVIVVKNDPNVGALKGAIVSAIGTPQVTVQVKLGPMPHVPTLTAPVTAGGRAGGGIIPMIPGASSDRDSVIAFLTPGEMVLNKDQQNALGGQKELSKMFGFAGGGIIQKFQGGGVAAGGGLPGYPAVNRPLNTKEYEKIGRLIILAELKGMKSQFSKLEHLAALTVELFAGKILEGRQDIEKASITLFDGLLFQSDKMQKKMEKKKFVPSVSMMRKDLATQTRMLRDFNNGLGRLGKRGAPLGMVQQLKELGPEASKNIKKLANATGKELKAYIKQWKQANKEIEKSGAPKLKAADLIRDMRSQRKSVEAFNRSMATLVKRKLPIELLKQLQELGLEGAQYLGILAKMTKKQLAAFLREWKRTQKALGKTGLLDPDAVKQQTADALEGAQSLWRDIASRLGEQFGALFAGGIIEGILSKQGEMKDAVASLMGGLGEGIVGVQFPAGSPDFLAQQHDYNEQLYDLQHNRNDILHQIDEDRNKQTKQADDDRAQVETDAAKEILNINKQLAEDIAQAQIDLAHQIKDAQTQFAIDTLDRMREAFGGLFDSVDASVPTLKEALDEATSQFGQFFSGVYLQSQEVQTRLEWGQVLNMDDLNKDLKSQVDMFKSWRSNLTTLLARNVPAEMAKQLEALGPEANDKIGLMVNATDKQLQDYIALWQASQTEIAKAAPEKVDLTKLIGIDDLTKSLQDQVGEFDNWKNALQALADKNVPQGLIDQLAQMGPDALKYLDILNSGTKGQLDAFVNTWKTGQDDVLNYSKEITIGVLGNAATQNEEIIRLWSDAKDAIIHVSSGVVTDLFGLQHTMTEQIYQMQKDTADSITKMREDAAKQIADVNANTAEELAKLTASVTESMDEVGADIADLTHQLGEIDYQMQQLGKPPDPMTFQSLLAGLQAQIDAFEAHTADLVAVKQHMVDSGFSSTDIRDFLGALEALGPEGAAMVAQLADATEPELARYVNLWLRGQQDIRDAQAATEVALSPEEVIADLQAQATAWTNYTGILADLRDRNIPAELMTQLENLGPSALPMLQALNNMTAEQLAHYIALWQTNGQQVDTETAHQFDDQIAAWREIGANMTQALIDGFAPLTDAIIAYITGVINTNIGRPITNTIANVGWMQSMMRPFAFNPALQGMLDQEGPISGTKMAGHMTAKVGTPVKVKMTDQAWWAANMAPLAFNPALAAQMNSVGVASIDIIAGHLTTKVGTPTKKLTDQQWWAANMAPLAFNAALAAQMNTSAAATATTAANHVTTNVGTPVKVKMTDQAWWTANMSPLPFNAAMAAQMNLNANGTAGVITSHLNTNVATPTKKLTDQAWWTLNMAPMPFNAAMAAQMNTQAAATVATVTGHLNTNVATPTKKLTDQAWWTLNMSPLPFNAALAAQMNTTAVATATTAANHVETNVGAPVKGKMTDQAWWSANMAPMPFNAAMAAHFNTGAATTASTVTGHLDSNVGLPAKYKLTDQQWWAANMAPLAFNAAMAATMNANAAGSINAVFAHVDSNVGLAAKYKLTDQQWWTANMAPLPFNASLAHQLNSEASATVGTTSSFIENSVGSPAGTLKVSDWWTQHTSPTGAPAGIMAGLTAQQAALITSWINWINTTAGGGTRTTLEDPNWWAGHIEVGLGGGCFTGDTVVKTPHGDIPISEIEEGEIIFAYSLSTGRVERTAVTEVFKHYEHEVLVVELTDDTIIRVTPEHRVWDYENEIWRPVGVFKVGDSWLMPEKGKIVIRSITPDTKETHDVYNLHVAHSAHNYMVANGVLVHNVKAGGSMLATGGIVPLVPGSSPYTDSVLASLTPGEMVLNQAQQNMLGGTRYLTDLLGFDRGGMVGGGMGSSGASGGPPTGDTYNTQEVNFDEGSIIVYAGADESLDSALNRMTFRLKNMDFT